MHKGWSWDPITGKILRYVYLNNRCHGNEKTAFAQRFPWMARKYVVTVQIKKGPKQSYSLSQILSTAYIYVHVYSYTTNSCMLLIQSKV